MRLFDLKAKQAEDDRTGLLLRELMDEIELTDQELDDIIELAVDGTYQVDEFYTVIRVS